jgi:hypothetical protein
MVLYPTGLNTDCWKVFTTCRFCDILEWIIQMRTPILGSVSLTSGSKCGSGPDPDLKVTNKNNIFPISFYAYFFSKVHLHHSSNMKSHNFLLVGGIPDPRSPKTYGSGTRRAGLNLYENFFWFFAYGNSK